MDTTSHYHIYAFVAPQTPKADFDRQVKALLVQFHPDGVLPLQVVATVIWGRPEGGMAARAIAPGAG